MYYRVAIQRQAERLDRPRWQWKSSVNESSWQGNGLVGGDMSTLERRRIELELGPGGDQDLSYSFVLPPSMPQVLAWMRLLAGIQRGELQL